MKKQLLLATFLMAFLSGSAQMWIKDGTVWTMNTFGSHRPDGAPGLMTVTLNQIDAEKQSDILEMESEWVSLYSDEKSHSNIGYLHTDGDKVYFSKTKDAPEWLLCYDFGMQPGEGAYIYSIAAGENEQQVSYLKCVSVADDREHDGWKRMVFEEYTDEFMTERLDRDEPVSWIKGLCGVRGLIENNLYGRDGAGMDLVSVTGGGRTIYSAKNVAMDVIPTDNTHVEIAAYTLCGVKVGSVQAPGSYVVVYDDGSSKKILVR